MKRIFLLAALTAPMVLTDGLAAAQGTKPVKSGAVVRGLTLTPLDPPAKPGMSTGFTCDFSGDAVGPGGELEDASVNCKPGGDLKKTMKGLPARFNAYCETNAPVSGARLIQSSRKDNKNHCSLSGITPKKATEEFGGAVWR
jgi:rhizosphere induced protein